MSKPTPYCIFIFLIFIIKAGNGAGDSASKSTLCDTTYNCGNGVVIKYPFWHLNDTTSNRYCGYPNFGISCSNGDPWLRLPSETYRVRNISYTDYTITLVDADAAKQECPRVSHNVTLGDLPLSYSNLTSNLSFYFNCTSNPFSHNAFSIDCFGLDSRKSYVTDVGSDIDGVDWLGKCGDHVVAAVMITMISDLINGYRRALNQGFLLDWRTARDCRACEASHGFCGYDDTEEALRCFCKNGEVKGGSCKGSGSKVKLKIGIGVAAALGGGLLTCAIFFIYQYRNKKKYTPSSFFSRSITSDPSSKTDFEKGGNSLGVPIFTYAELEEATNNFDSSKELGDGGFGTVYYGKLRDGRAVAVKRLYENNYRRVEQFMNEVKILTHLRHQHLVTLYGCTSRHSRELLLVYEYISNGTVADHLHGERAKPGALPWPTRMNIAVDTASALAYLHASDIIHRDVKTNNILLDNHFCVKVADFGLSRLFPTDVTHVSTAPQGTPGYVDPEYHQCYQLTDKSDVYSFGVVLIELISSMPAVDITRHRHEINLANMAINKIQSHALHELVDPNLGFESDYKARKMMAAVAELAFRCLQCEKELRPSMEEVLQILEEIRRRDYSSEKAQKIDNLSDDIVLLKNSLPPLSPDSVAVKWISLSSTPSSSS